MWFKDFFFTLKQLNFPQFINVGKKTPFLGIIELQAPMNILFLCVLLHL